MYLSHELAEHLLTLPNYPVKLTTGDGAQDIPLGDVLNVAGQIILCAEPTDTMDSVKFAIAPSKDDEEGTPTFFVAVSLTGEAEFVVGPPTYDYLVCEQVVRHLFEQATEFLDAYSAGSHHEFVSDAYDLFGGP